MYGVFSNPAKNKLLAFAVPLRVGVHHEICGLHVPVHHRVCMQVIEALQDAGHSRTGLRLRHACPRRDTQLLHLKRASLNILHHLRQHAHADCQGVRMSCIALNTCHVTARSPCRRDVDLLRSGKQASPHSQDQSRQQASGRLRSPSTKVTNSGIQAEAHATRTDMYENNACSLEQKRM